MWLGSSKSDSLVLVKSFSLQSRTSQLQTDKNWTKLKNWTKKRPKISFLMFSGSRIPLSNRGQFVEMTHSTSKNWTKLDKMDKHEKWDKIGQK